MGKRYIQTHIVYVTIAALAGCMLLVWPLMSLYGINWVSAGVLIFLAVCMALFITLKVQSESGIYPQNTTLPGATETDSAEQREIEAIYEILHEKVSERAHGIKNFLVTIGTLILFIIAGSTIWRIETLIAVIMALTIHEAGHLLPMWLLGYKNIKMMFIPFIGGVVSGDADRDHVTNISIITILGPSIGMLSAVVSGNIYDVTGQEIFLTYTKIALFLNGINLLPIYPLDGGRLMNDLLFSRSLKLEIGFKLITGTILLIAGLLMRELILVFIGVIVVLPLKDTMAMACVVKEYRQTFGQRLEYSREAIQFLRGKLLRAIPRTRKSKRATKILADQIKNIVRNVNRIEASPRTSFLFVSVYIVTVFILPFLVIYRAH